MKIALVHDWLRVNAGSEKVVAEMLKVFEGDEVTIFTLFDKLSVEDRDDIIGNVPVVTSMLQRVPKIERFYRFLLPIMPLFIRQFYLKDFDLIISSSHAIAKGFRRKKSIPHVCYCHTPMRYAWDMFEDYTNDSKRFSAFVYWLLVRFIRNWDFRTSKNVDYFIANSINVQQRIKTHYQCDSKVIYPPVRVNDFVLSINKRKDVYLCLGRFVPYKKIDVIISAFTSMPDKKLLLIGDGYDAPKVVELLQHVPNITWLGYKNDQELIRLMQEAKACIFAAKEDFGIMCVEVQSCGTPVIAMNHGGYKETVIEGITGYHFEQQTEEAIKNAVHKFEAIPLKNHSIIRRNAELFSAEKFRVELKNYVLECIDNFKSKNCL